ncbi:MAG: endopeptidase La, partial [Clostridia bacterium]|nr:endopeptidase La [Clostridia bacterium]
ALSGRPCRRDVAMTGEITLHGRILPIGGLREKSFAAYRSGIKTVLIPKENLKDLTEVDDAVNEAITFIPCETVSDALSLALGPAPEKAEAQKTEFGTMPRIIPEPIKPTISEQATV